MVWGERMDIRVKKIVDLLKSIYPDADCTLDFAEAWQLLFSTRLAAQCTDARVNIVAEVLYKRYPTLEAMAEADIEELSQIVKPCGFYHTKAKDIKSASKILIEKYNSVVPDTMEELLTLPGIGRKTANLILGEVYHKPAVVTDTHCIRLSNRLGIVSTDDPGKVETALREQIPENEQLMLCHRFVYHGRAVCAARSPKCGVCILSEVCPKTM